LENNNKLPKIKLTVEMESKKSDEFDPISESEGSEESKKPIFDGYREYRNTINLNKLFTLTYSFDPI
jgi:hypothetical protein